MPVSATRPDPGVRAPEVGCFRRSPLRPDGLEAAYTRPFVLNGTTVVALFIETCLPMDPGAPDCDPAPLNTLRNAADMAMATGLFGFVSVCTVGQRKR